MRAQLIIGVIMALLLVAGRYWFFLPETLPSEAVVPTSFSLPDETPLYIAPMLGELYTDTRLGFSFKVPEGFSVRTIADGQERVTLGIENTSGDGVQILITPFDETVSEISAAMVRADIPDLRVTDEQTIEIGTRHRGVAFLSDNEAFGGASREVWFPFRGNLYQISTYARLDPLLQSIFSTWKFL